MFGESNGFCNPSIDVAIQGDLILYASLVDRENL